MGAKLEQQFKKAAESHAKFYNKKHRPQSYNVWDKIFLNSKNIESNRLSKSLDYKFYGLIGKQAYRLKLSGNMKTHNVFHVLLLEPCRNIPEDAQPPPIEWKGKGCSI